MLLLYEINDHTAGMSDGMGIRLAGRMREWEEFHTCDHKCGKYLHCGKNDGTHSGPYPQSLAKPLLLSMTFTGILYAHWVPVFIIFAIKATAYLKLNCQADHQCKLLFYCPHMLIVPSLHINWQNLAFSDINLFYFNLEF